jgi:hypothetical protein
MKIFAGVIGLVILLGGLWQYQKSRQEILPSTETTSAIPMRESAPEKVSIPSSHPAFSWSFSAAGEDERFNAPLTRVMLVWGGNRHDLGVYMGTCAEFDTYNDDLQDGEITGALCWWAGAGDELGVFYEKDGYVVKRGEQQEPSAEDQGFRGNFTVLKAL